MTDRVKKDGSYPNSERAKWVENTEHIYNEWIDSEMTMGAFLAKFGDTIDEYIRTHI